MFVRHLPRVNWGQLSTPPLSPSLTEEQRAPALIHTVQLTRKDAESGMLLGWFKAHGNNIQSVCKLLYVTDSQSHTYGHFGSGSTDLLGYAGAKKHLSKFYLLLGDLPLFFKLKIKTIVVLLIILNHFHLCT